MGSACNGACEDAGEGDCDAGDTCDTCDTYDQAGTDPRCRSESWLADSAPGQCQIPGPCARPRCVGSDVRRAPNNGSAEGVWGMTLHRTRRWIGVVGALGALTGCPECAPEQVGEGIARLTVRNVYGMVVLLGEDESCGFASPAVLGAALVQGSPGALGTVTYRVDDCTIDLGDGRVFLEDCNGVTLRGSGRVTLSATRTVEGTLTGNPQNPIIPASADAVTIEITEAQLDDFQVTRSDSEDSVRMLDGTLTAVAVPRLAVSASTGLCTVSTPNTAFRNIRYDDANVRMFTDNREFEADVLESNIRAQLGRRGEEENTVGGTMTVFGSDVDVEGDDVLDDDYDRETFLSGYACREDIATPVSFECIALEDTLSDASARLGLAGLASLAAVLDADTTCGFSSPAALQGAQLVGIPGSEGTLSLTVTDCALDLTQSTTLPADCSGWSRTLQGVAVVQGTKVVRGLITGDPAAPILPLTSQPITTTLDLVFNNLRVGNTVDDNALLIRSGTARAVVQPALYVGRETGLCTVATPNVDFSEVTWEDANVSIVSSNGTFDLIIEEAALSGTSGTTAAGTNLLQGTITVNGEERALNADNRGLDPAYDAETFAASWQCNAELALPLSSACREAGLAVLGGGAAAQGMRNISLSARTVEQDTACGFSSPTTIASATFVEDVDGLITATFTLPEGGCTISHPTPFDLFTDCLGQTTTMTGTLIATGTKTITGIATGDPASPILPTRTNAMRFDLDFVFNEVGFQTGEAPVGLIVHSGSASAAVSPRLALDPVTETCTIAVPIVTLADVTWADANVTLPFNVGGEEAQTILVLEGSDLNAQAGSGLNQQNTLQGTVRILGDSQPLDGPLDPDFNAEAFASTWNCAALGSPQLVDDARCALAAAD